MKLDPVSIPPTVYIFTIAEVFLLLLDADHREPPPTSSSNTNDPMKLTDDIIEELEEAILATTLSSPGLPSKGGGDSTDPNDPNPLFVLPSEDNGEKKKQELIDNMDLKSDFAETIDSDKREMFKKSWQADYNVTEDDEDLVDEVLEAAATSVETASVPLHILFYGKNHNRLDSYSIMNLKGQQQSHVYVTVSYTHVGAQGNQFSGRCP